MRPARPPPDPALAHAHALHVRTLALVGYGLVIASFFTAWITGLVAWGLAFAYRKTPDTLARSHFRHQLGITDVFGVMAGLGIALALWGGWTAFAPLFQGGEFDGSRLLGGGLWVLLGLSVWAIGTLVAVSRSVIGIFRLLRGDLARPGRPVGGAAGGRLAELRGSGH